MGDFCLVGFSSFSLLQCFDTAGPQKPLLLIGKGSLPEQVKKANHERTS